MRREPAIIEGMEQHGNNLAGRRAETETGTAAVAPRRRWPQRVAIALVVLVVAAVLAAAAFFAYVGDFYHDLDAASHDLASTEALPVQQGESYLAFGDTAAETGIVLYRARRSSTRPTPRSCASWPNADIWPWWWRCRSTSRFSASTQPTACVRRFPR